MLLCYYIYMTQNKYTIFIKGWGEYEDAWYPHNTGDNTYTLKKQVFENWNMEAEFYIRCDNTEEVVEEGFVNKGIYS